MTTAAELVRRSSPCELRRGAVHRLDDDARAPARVAARLARALQPAAEAADAWVSCEALIRVARNPDTALRPVVAVVDAPLPYDGVVDSGLLVVVELDPGRISTWRAARATTAPTIWIPQARGVLVADATTTVVVANDRPLRLPGRAGATVAAADLCRLIGVSG